MMLWSMVNGKHTVNVFKKKGQSKRCTQQLNDRLMKNSNDF